MFALPLLAVAALAGGCGADRTATWPGNGLPTTPGAGAPVGSPGRAASTGEPDWQTVSELPLGTVPEEVALQPSPRGGGVATWEEYDRDQVMLASVEVNPAGSFGEVKRVRQPEGGAPSSATPPTPLTGQAISAAGADGHGVVALSPTSFEDTGFEPGGDRIYAWPSRTSNGVTTFGPRADLGPNLEFTFLSATVLPSGNAAVLWGTQDGGEEANEPWRVRVATIAPDGRVLSRQVLDPGGVDRPDGGLAIVATAQGRLVAAWNSVRRYDERPLVVAVSDTAGRFGGARQELDATGSPALAAAPDGTVLATWTASEVESALLTPGASRFVKDFRTGPVSEFRGAPGAGFTGSGEPLIVAPTDAGLVARVRR